MTREWRLSPPVRSVFAVIDGLLLFLAIEGIFYAVAFLLLHRSFDTPTVPYLSANLLWAVLSAGIAGFTTATVARRQPILHGFFVALPLILLALYNLNKGIGGRRTLFVILYNVLVPLAVIAGAALVRSRIPHTSRQAHTVRS